ncbi:amidohydrolase family protein [Streptomyces sp. NPDC006967]|uniref:metal-dependent hydrolase family protein n=1 Tax=unclassified Streptomyces TaxID=2593676 RepID=UPI001C667B55|nr:amidohydrolase family protein [Streptomyces sp. SM1]
MDTWPAGTKGRSPRVPAAARGRQAVPHSSPPVLIKDVRVFDGLNDDLSASTSVLIKDRLIDAIGGTQTPEDALVVEGGGRVLVPGLTDAHTHLFAIGASQAALTASATGTCHYTALLQAESMLLRGFTTVRDMAGDVTPLRHVLDTGAFPGPRIYPSQAAISQTSGHGDFSAVYENATAFSCGAHPRAEEIGFMRVADGRDQVLAAVREQLKRGATQIKVMAGGGVASPYDPLDVIQYTLDELRAAVEAAADWGTYVAAHVYNDAGIHRAIDAGITSIEHGHLVEGEETLRRMAAEGVWLSTQPFLAEDHEYADPVNAEKNRQVCDGVAQSFEWARSAGTRIAFGTDLMLEPGKAARQSTMFTRLEHDFGFSAPHALRLATSENAELFRLSGERDPYRAAPLGRIVPGAWADVLLVEGEPTRSTALFGEPAKNLAVIIKDGRVYKNLLA